VLEKQIAWIKSVKSTQKQEQTHGSWYHMMWVGIWKYTFKNRIKILQAIQEHKSRNPFQEHEPNRTSTSNSNWLKQEPKTNYWLETFNSNIWPMENEEQET